MSSTLYTCNDCHREWDGNAQCPCWMDLQDSDEELTSHNKIKKPIVKNVSTQTKQIRWGKTILERAQESVDSNYYIIFKSNTL